MSSGLLGAICWPLGRRVELHGRFGMEWTHVGFRDEAFDGVDALGVRLGWGKQSRAPVQAAQPAAPAAPAPEETGETPAQGEELVAPY